MLPLVKAPCPLYVNTFTKLPTQTRDYFKYQMKPNIYNVFIQNADEYFIKKAFFTAIACSFLKLICQPLYQSQLN